MVTPCPLVVIRQNTFARYPGYWAGREIITPDVQRFHAELDLIWVDRGVLIRKSGPARPPHLPPELLR